MPGKLSEIHVEILAVKDKLDAAHKAIDMSRFASCIIAAVIIAAFVFGLLLRGWL